MDRDKISASALEPFVPQIILDWFRRHPPPQKHLVSRHVGVVMHIDVSGFTALTRLISAEGRSGIEELTIVLNSFFDAIAEEIIVRQGDVLKFAGDALWAFFPTTVNPGEVFSSIRERVQEVNSRSEITRRQPLEIHVGAEFGYFHLASFGDPENRLEAEPVGPLIDDVITACDLAGSGALVLGHKLAAMITPAKQLEEVADGFFELKPDRPTTIGEKWNTPAFSSDSLNVDDSLKPYLSDIVRERLQGGEGRADLQSEIRRVTVLFARFEYGYDGDIEKAVGEINVILRKVLAVAGHHGGILARIDPCKNGHKILILFGAPRRSEDDELKAIYCAARLINFNSNRFRIGIGLALGTLFCGEVGSRRRKEYTVMGDGINMAARLMAQADWGTILIDPRPCAGSCRRRSTLPKPGCH